MDKEKIKDLTLSNNRAAIQGRYLSESFFIGPQLIDQFMELTNHIRYFIRTVSKISESIDKSSDAYFEIRNHWKHDDIHSSKYYKALLLDDTNKLICEISFKPRQQINNRDIQSMIDLLKIHKASKVFLGHNKPANQEVLPSENEKTIARKFKVTGDKNNITFVDQLIMNDCESYSFEENGL